MFRGDKAYLGNKSFRVHTSESVHAKIFIEFVALIIRSRFYTCLKEQMQKSRKKNYMTVPAAIREPEKIELIRQSDRGYRMYSEYTYQSDPERDEPSADITLDEVGLCKEQKFALQYDFGDDWMFTITVSKISEVQENFKPRIVKSKGSIQQYPNWDEEDFDDE